MKQFFLLALLVTGITAFSQTDTTTPPFVRFPTLPPIKILLGDSVSFYSKADIPKNKPVLFMIFSPECSHCQHETEELIAHKNELKDVQIVMVTMYPFEQMKDFISKYGLNSMPNVVVGRDVYYFTPGFFALRNLPFLALYDKKGELIRGAEGSVGINEVIQSFNAHK